MQEIFFVIEECNEGGLTAKAIGHSIFTEADDIETLITAVEDALHCHFG